VRVDNEVFWRKDGTCFPVEYVARQLVHDGIVSGTVVAFADVSERRRLDRMKDEFISTVSHELRTPLTSLRAALGLIAGGVLEKRPEKHAQMLDVAIGNCDRLVRLVNDILDFERIGSGRLPLHREKANAVDLLRRAADLQHTAAASHNITFRIDAQPVDVMVDVDRTLQTLTNLISNAVKFSPPGDEVRLTASATGENEVTFEVEDHGRGIPPEKLEIIFERFQQVDASDSRSMGGTGLGLAICRAIVEQHGGRISVHSKLGQGSVFTFTMPRSIS
jgi:signal transduction histidine kinase